MNFRKITPLLAGVAVAALLTTATACSREKPIHEGPETSAEETYVTVTDGALSFRDGIPTADYPPDSAQGAWLTGCAAPDRDEQFDVYVLRTEYAADGNTVFTYLIYYPHGGAGLTASPALLEGEGGYELRIRYAEGGGVEVYSLCSVTVTLPTDQAPRLRLLAGDEPLDVLSSVYTP